MNAGSSISEPVSTTRTRNGFFRVGLARLYLLQRLAQLVYNKILRADEADKLYNVELVAGDGWVVQLSQLAQLADNGAQLIMRIYRGAYGVVGNVHAKLIVQRLEKLGFSCCS